MPKPTSLPALFLAAAAAACGGSSGPTIESTHFASSLNVDLHASTKTPDGEYYRDLVPGTGDPAVPGQAFAARYTGWLADGTQFDSNTFPLVLGIGQVIQGWDEGLLGMNAGGTRQLIIPPALGYGAQKKGPIPGNSILVFTVQLNVPTIETTAFATALGVSLADSVKMASGEYYRDIAAGTGAAVASGQTIQAHYTGWFADGQQFDSNVGGSAFSFVIGKGQVIPGWDQGLVGARVGGTRQLVIPAALGYGTLPYGSIPGNSILVFNVTIDSAH